MKALARPESGRFPASLLAAGALMCGAAAYFASRFLETRLAAGMLPSVLIEEALKAGALILLSLAGTAATGRTEGNTALSRRIGAARGLGFGLVATVVFAGAENLSYALAFPDAGLFARLWWSTPAHILAAELSALGLWPILAGPVRASAEKTGGGEKLASRLVMSLCGFTAAVLVHLAANFTVLSYPAIAVSPAAGFVFVAATLTGYGWLSRSVYIGGLFHD